MNSSHSSSLKVTDPWGLVQAIKFNPVSYQVHRSRGQLSLTGVAGRTRPAKLLKLPVFNQKREGRHPKGFDRLPHCLWMLDRKLLSKKVLVLNTKVLVLNGVSGWMRHAVKKHFEWTGILLECTDAAAITALSSVQKCSFPFYINGVLSSCSSVLWHLFRLMLFAFPNDRSCISPGT